MPMLHRLNLSLKNKQKKRQLRFTKQHLSERNLNAELEDCCSPSSVGLKQPTVTEVLL